MGWIKLLYFDYEMVIFLINTFNQQGCNKLIKRDRKDIYKVTKDFYLIWMQFFSTFYSKNPEKIYHGSHKAAQMFDTCY